ncbi:MAG: VCBS repeat-containing protein, partial [Flavobacteriales bacterium]|nr:VCBS repeat-containing protein [Flavobacteriales bacterium]
LVQNNDGSFSSSTDVFMGSYAYGSATGDWDGDGDMDLAWANNNTGGVTINLNNGDASFPAIGNVFYSSGGNSVELDLGDFDEDGIQDIIVANGVQDNFAFLKGNGDGLFGKLTLLAGYGAAGICSADFNSDGHPDILNTNHFPPYSLALSLNNGDGSFQPTTFADAPYSSEECISSDINLDGNMDVVVHAAGGFTVIPGNGNGTFSLPVAYPSVNNGSGGERTIVSGDFNGDGNTDLAGAKISDNIMAVVYGNGDGTFGPPATYEGMNYPRALVSGDLNGDGADDIAITSIDDEVLVFFGGTDSQLSDPLHLDTPGSPSGICTFDCNTDGNSDLIVVAAGLGKIYTFIGYGDGTFTGPIETNTP